MLDLDIINRTVKIIIITSSFPRDIKDNSGLFVKEQILNLLHFYPDLKFHVLVSSYFGFDNSKKDQSGRYKITRFHYFLPFFEKLAGNNILSTLKNNKFYYLLIPFYVIFQFFNLFILTIRLKPDLIYAHWFTPQAINAYLVSKLLKVPYSFTSHSSDIEILKNKLPILGKKLIRKVILNSKSISTPSKAISDKVEFYLSDTERKKINISVIPMGVNTLGFQSTKEKQFKELINTEFIFFIGNFVEKKGIDLLIRAFSKIEKLQENYKLVIAGDGYLMNYYMDLVRELNLQKKVIFTGKIGMEEKKFLYKNCSLVVVPSIKTQNNDIEGMPVVLLEAMYFNNICITSEYANPRDLIIDGKNGFIIVDIDVSKLSECIYKVINMEEQKKELIKKQAFLKAQMFDSYNSATNFYEKLLK